MLPHILEKFERTNVCNGIGAVIIHHLQADQVFQDYLEQWHHRDCSLISKTKLCNSCLQLRKVLLQKEARFNKSTRLKHIFVSSNPIEKKKIMIMRKKNNCIRRMKNRAKFRVTLLLQSLQKKKEEISRIAS